MAISKSPNFDIEAFYFDFDVGPDIGLRYRSPLTSISQSLISQNFKFDIEDFRLRYRSNTISKITSISKLKFMYGYRSFVLRYRRSSISTFSLILSGPACTAQNSESECRLQPRTEVPKHSLQRRKFIATQFLAQDLKQYPVRSA
jgi:hypothetical protein